MKKTIQEAFMAQANSCPNNIALIHEEHSITYKELNERSNQVANYLKQLGLVKNSVIGICLDRGLDSIVSMIGVLKAGHTYLPLDPSYPVNRLRYMHEHAQASAILCDSNNLGLFPNTENLIDITNINSSKEDYVLPSDNVYVIYTSGSTGVPKGVLLGQACLVNLLNWQSRHVIHGTTLQFAPVSFDVHFQEIFGTLLSGQTLYIVSEKQRKDLLTLVEAIGEYDIKRAFLPFVALEQICKLALSNDLYPACLEEVVTAGEQLRINENIREFFKRTKARLHNHYGPSETHVCVAKTLSRDVSSWPSLPAIGVSIDGAKTLVLDQNMNQVPEGELYVGGSSVAEGYIYDENRTSERFITINNNIFYKTGDLVRTNMDGELEFVARIDGQVKISGHRIELGEIENCAQQALPNADICSTVKTLESGEKVICVYVCGEYCEKALRDYLRDSLPEYMLPRFVIGVDSFPLTPSGKLNREELPMPKMKRGDLASEYEPPRDFLEKEIVEIWKGLLSINEIGVNDKFFDLGGTSLLAMDLVEKLKNLRPNISAVELFEAATVRQQAQLIKPKKVKTLRTNKKQGGADVAIVSMTGRFPGANSLDELWEMLSGNEEGVEKFSPDQLHPSVDKKFIKNKNYVLATGEYKDCKRFDANFFGMTPREAELMDPQQRKFLELNWEALELAGINPNNCDEVIGIFAGCANNTYQSNIAHHKDKIDEFGDFNVMLANEKDYIATRVAYKLNLKGPAISVHTGCSTSLVAIAQAVQAIRNGQCDIALAGGISIDGQLKTGYMHQEGAIYSSDGRCRPYSSNASGTIFTNGAGVVTLMPKDLAIEKGQEILGVIKGVGINNDGNDKMSFTAPSIQGQTDAILMAFDDANLKPEDVVYIEGHGTATPVGDPIEVAALARAFESLGANSSHKCLLGSIKSNVGHMTAAAGVAGVIKACLIFKHKLVPASIGIERTNPEIDFENSWFTPVQKNTSITDGKAIGVSSFGVGGTNAHVLIQGPLKEDLIPSKSREELFFLSAKTEQALKSMQSKLDQTLKKSNQVDTSYTLCKREEFSFRTTRVSGSAWSPITKKADKQIVFMFPGQGSQYVGMGKELMDTFPSFKSDFEYCCEVASELMSKDLKAVMLGEANEEDALNNTFYTQPAILIFEYCLGRLVQRFGIKASGYIGHSIGELCACVFNGVLSIEQAIEIVIKRSELMSGVEPGSMMSVTLSKDRLEEKLPENIQVAAVNSRQSTVVAGPTTDIENLANELEAEGFGTKLLHTSHAFHSKMMAPMVDEFKSFLTKFKFNPPNNPMISTVTGDFETDHFCSPGYWAEHVARPVMFAPAIGKQINEKNIFLEIGPRTTLRQLGMSEAVNKKVKSIFLSLSSQDTSFELRAFLAGLGRLWQEGVEFHKELLFEGRTPKITSTVTYEFGGKEYWLEAIGNTAINKEMNTLDRGENMQSARTRLRDRIVEVIESASGIEIADFTDETSFFEMGMDSLFLTQIALKLKKGFKQEISFRQLTEQYDDVQKLTEYLADYVSMEEGPISLVPKQTAASKPGNPSLNSNFQVSDSSVDALVKEQLQIMKLQLEVLSSKVQEGSQIMESFIQEPPSRPVKNLKDKEKRNFGAMAKISSDKSTLDEKSIEFIKTFITKYTDKTSKSKAFTQDNRKIHSDPRVVTGFRPESKEMVYPIVTKSSVGQKLIDLDGNEYVDMLCGFGSNFFGNNNREINEAIKKQIDIGMEIGPQSPLVSAVANLIGELTGNERSAFCNTGSEAVLGAMRVARTVSGRETIVCFSGSYHGINDEVIVRASSNGKSLPAAPGVHSSSVKEMVVLDYGTDESFEKIKALCEQGELAAVLVEPVQSRRCDFHPKEFLQKLRTLTEQHDVCLIFDEVITGFRIHPGGAQAHFDVRADLCTYGKIVGGGMPIGVLSGKSKYMDALDGGHWEFGDDSIPTVGVTYFAGTFVRHPLALAAAKKALEIIKKENTHGLSKLNQKTQQWVDDINSFCEVVGSNLRFSNFGSLVKPKWIDGDYIHSDLFFASLRMYGVHQYDGFPWFINLAHTDTELEFVKGVIKQVVTELQLGGVMSSNGRELKNDQMNCLSPPVLGAKLGKDKNGNPGWFIPHPEKQGQYYQLQ